ncbi:histone-lysine N-methyltransferase NSD2 isoform X2 [Chelonus insularis]|uniref:histone-lysine N-methyltransferase NSD2 isoform X2 n=1 Tax=Chelonus insularis TaxID=460826 RepID=UPI00158F3224|nr:histone-lysine N-methyltransferase NSD2 isoform X2 [Chelonus insularis]
MNTTSEKDHETNQQHHTKVQEECPSRVKTHQNSIKSVDNENLKTVNASSSTSRYGRAIKQVNNSSDNNTTKMKKMVKNSRSTERNVDDKNVGNDNLENDDVAVIANIANKIVEKIPEAESSDSGKKKWWKEPEACRWKVGELGWAQISTFPYWPCIVTLDPEGNKHTKWRSFGKSTANMVHVQYFGDKGRHNWISEGSMMLFTSLADFNKMANEWLSQPEFLKKKEPKKTAGFTVKQCYQKKWNIAVQEAEELIPLNLADRIKAIQPKKKRRRSEISHDSMKDVVKRTKLSEPLKNGLKKRRESDKNHDEDDSKSVISLDGDAPLTPPSSHKDSSDESIIVKKVMKKMKQPEPLPSFDLYYQRNKQAVANISPDSTEDDIKIYLKKSWENMREQARRKYIPQIVRNKHNLIHSDSTFSEESPPKRKRQSKKHVNGENDIIEIMKKTKIPNLFRGTKPEKVCQICEKTGNLIRCKGPCYSYFHLTCVKPGDSESEFSADDGDKPIEESKEKPVTITIDDDEKKENSEESFKCIDCLSGVAPACFICHEREEERIRCSTMTCGKHYHTSCLKAWPQSHLQGGRLTCPYHMCHTCASDNPQNGYARAQNEKLIKCVRCPSTYHASTACLPAGSEILTGSQMICTKHYKPPHPPLNAAWCFLCTKGGSLICCDTCPTSFHAECLRIKAPDGAFICEDCETGRLPLYGEIVWVKLGNYRWWPSRICFPHEVPPNILAVAHKPGEFCVMFLGTLNYYWVHRGRVFLYQDDDSNVKNSVNKTNVDEAYNQALKEASELHQRLKRERKDDESRALKPPPYVKLKVNKPVGNVKPTEVESIVACECDARWENPCSPDTDCLNRILSIECSPGICPAGPRCRNQCFARRQYPAMEPFHTRARGWGLKTLENIKSGQFVIEYVGEVIDEAEYKRRVKRKKELRNENYYFLTIDNFRTIDAEPKGNLSRFMNHSCQPNCETQKWTVNGDTRIGLFALRDIEVGEELTFNYNLASDGETRKPCLCGAPNCSGYIGLKAQKLSLTPVQQTKMEKVPERRRNRRSRRIYKCWRCKKDLADTDEYVECDLKTCSKRYHRKCVSRRGETRKFSCPWHHCVECKKRTSAHCAFCPIAYCQVHIEGKLTEYKGEKGGYVCKIHEDVEDADSRKSLSPVVKEESDNDTEADRESLLADSDSPISEPLQETSPQVTIVETKMFVGPRRHRRRKKPSKRFT